MNRMVKTMAKQAKKTEAPTSDAQKHMRRLMSAGWKLGQIARAVDISPGAAARWVAGANATERFLVQLAQLPSTPPEGKPAVNKLDAPKAGKKTDRAVMERFAAMVTEAAELAAEPKPATRAERRRAIAHPKRTAEVQVEVVAVPARRARKAKSIEAGHMDTDEANALLEANAAPQRGSIKVTAAQVSAMAAALHIDPLELLERMGQLRFDF